MKKMLPNKIPVELIDLVKETAHKESRTVNSWLQFVLWKACGRKPGSLINPKWKNQSEITKL